ncbi:MAG: 4Fe-4S dicluster domain-containing protein [Cytophagales bacterium]|nr:MAG: 4Fe-4S dicluster domain-containing protein [Cytophagales bacterium]
MNGNNKKYWKGIEELSNDPQFIKNSLSEFPDFLPIKESSNSSDEDSSNNGRRDFLKLLGFSVTAASLAACEAPIKKVIPYVNKPEDVDPGIANWYASTYQNGGEYASILVKTREGRPIKIEGNPMSSVTGGGSSARVQASVLSLYDTERLQYFKESGKKIKIDEADNKITAALNTSASIRIISSSINSPSTLSVISEFKNKYPVTEHIQYDANSVSGLLKANQISFGNYVVPSYDFSKANVIVSFGADFLGTWISPIEYSKQYAKGKKLGKSKKTMVRHYQIETNLSLTGSNADTRLPIKPSQEGLLVAELFNQLSSSKLTTKSIKNATIDKIAKDLLSNRGKSIVVSGSNDVNIQLIVNEINNLLGNYANTIDISKPCNLYKGDDTAMYNFIQDAKNGKISSVIFYNCNPVYDHPLGGELSSVLSKISTTVSFSDREDETASLCKFICPDTHYLESWNDAEPKKGIYSLAQPTITPLFKENRSAQESLLSWISTNPSNYYNYIQSYWSANILKTDFQSSWDLALHNGVFEVNSESLPSTFVSSDLSQISSEISKKYQSDNSAIEVKLYEKVGIGTGNQANNPWLQEFPDPISKVTWDNYVAVSHKYAKDNQLAQGALVNVTINGKAIDKPLPLVIQPGQANGTFSLAIGYGRSKAGKCANNVGVNAYPFLTYTNGTLQYYANNITISATGEVEALAQTQTHETIMARPIIQDSILSEYIKNPDAGRFHPMVTTPDGKKKPVEISAWSGEHKFPNHKWGMVIDLNSCTGCGACVISCQAENNVPVVGKKEVSNRREMHWIRIDRYYSSDAEMPEKGVDKYFKRDDGSTYNDLEQASENPQVTYQPMMCQHCNHAPCETVCPVAATPHSSEGLNMMAYNRCIGTRYCANNCPYKVRRFNWFKYFDNSKFPENTSMNNTLGKMVLNPDVTVRSRGVMEKCSLCVQRIQEGKLTAKKEGRRPKDGEIKTACASSCPSEAIVFGDMNDSETEIFNQLNLENKERAYHVLEELNVQPNVSYLTKIRNV